MIDQFTIENIATDRCRKCSHAIRLTWNKGWQHPNIFYAILCNHPRPLMCDKPKTEGVK